MEPSDNFIFRSGKYEGKSYGLVKKMNPGYLDWVKLNQPKMLEEGKSKPVPVAPTQLAVRKEVPENSEVISSSLGPNLDFLKQVGDSHFKTEETDGDKS
jgi:hypothetical protein